MINKIILSLTILTFLRSPSFAAGEAISNKGSDSQKITASQIDQSNFANVAILQGLNKITAKTSEFEIKVGDSVEFGKLIIIVHKCWQSPADQRPESKILLEIYENINEDTKNKIFYGWMFASSPSISSLEHPIYDVTALGCKFR
jgi:hypothetical protein